jgi:hypothetical protein
LQLSGLHRTASEIADEGKVRHGVYGFSWRYRTHRLQLGANAVYQHLSRPLQRDPVPYNQFRFQGMTLGNVGADYSIFFRNVHVFGETAWSDNGAVATVNGLLATIHRGIDVALLYRMLPRDYHHLGATPFAETSSGENEQGIYLGVEIRPGRSWKVSAYHDVWKHPWLRFNADAPSTGDEQLIRITFHRKRSIEAYVQYRHERKERNLTGSTAPFDLLVDRHKHQLRVHCSYKVSRDLELRSRIEALRFREHIAPAESGFMIYQDILYKPVGTPLSFTMRIGLFDTDSFDSAIYAYENDLVNQFHIPAHAYRGVRSYLNVRYRGLRNLSLEFRVAQTRYTERDTIGSGNDQIEGNTRTDLKAQMILDF